MYRFYFKQGNKQVLLPVTPSEIRTKTGNHNKTSYVLNIGEVSLLKKVGLQEVSFTLLLPNTRLSFVQVEDGFHPPSYFLDTFYEMKASKEPIQFIIFRKLADGTQLFCGNMEMSFEEYSILERGGEQGDFWVEIHLKEYKKAQSIRFDVKNNGGSASVSEVRSVEAKSKGVTAQSYTVKKGDTLWEISKKQLGDGARFAEIAKKNNIADPNKIYPGQVLVLR